MSEFDVLKDELDLDLSEYDKNNNSLPFLEDFIDKVLKSLIYLGRRDDIRNLEFAKRQKIREGRVVPSYEIIFKKIKNRNITDDELVEFLKLFNDPQFEDTLNHFIDLQNQVLDKQRLYHGTIASIDGTINPSKSVDLNQEKAVLATNKKFIALAFIPRWGDEDLTLGRTNDNNYYLKEKYSGAFKEIFQGLKGYIYHVDSSGFESDPRLKMKEVIFASKNPVKILKKEVINDVWAQLKNFSELKLIQNSVIQNQRPRTRKTRVQSILFHKEIFKTKEQCIAWIKRQNKERKGRDYDFIFSKYDPPDSPTEMYHRFRQFDPDPDKEHRTSLEGEIDKGVKFVYEY